MFARIAVWEPMPDDDRQWVIDAAKSIPGVLSAYAPAAAHIQKSIGAEE